MRWIKTLWRWLTGTFDREFGESLVDGIRAVTPYLPDIYAAVRRVAEMTPTRADDEILAAAEAFGVSAAIEQRTAVAAGAALAAIVEAWARKRWPNAPARQLRRAIEIAYGALRP